MHTLLMVTRIVGWLVFLWLATANFLLPDHQAQLGQTAYDRTLFYWIALVWIRAEAPEVIKRIEAKKAAKRRLDAGSQ